MLSNIDFTKTQLAVYFGVLILAVDSINPVKIFLHVFPSVHPWHLATISCLLIAYVFISEMKALLYFSMKIFFHSILSIFFREVEIIGRDNIPRYGPVIFSCNHANQFIDAVNLLCTCEHKISYLIAEKSWKRRIVGDMAWALDCVPVKRSQDSALKGSGEIALEESASISFKVNGTGTAFTSEINVGDKIRHMGTSLALKVESIASDTEMTVNSTSWKDGDALPESAVPFDILKRIDQKVVYEKVLEKLASGGAIGIFPEGGSHDRTDLLPLKVGVALIAYSALEKDGLNVPIVPVGLNYFRAHRFRGRVVVEYGQPTYIDPLTLDAYKSGGQERRQVCNSLLDAVEDSMKSVIVSTPDYETLQVVHTARRLYQGKELKASDKQDLNRRFAEGYRRLMMLSEGSPPKEWLDLQDKILAYDRELKDLGIKDYQVPALSNEKYEYDGDTVLREMRLPYQLAHIFLMVFLAAIPAAFLNLPVGLLARLYALKRRRKALRESKVKIKAFDVMLTEKVLLCIVLVPSLWVFYGFLLWNFTDWDGPTIALVIMSLPLFSYMGIVVAEAGMVDIKDVRPFVMRLFPSARRRLSALPAARKDLEKELRGFIKQVGPQFGELYYKKELDWKEIQRKSRTESVVGKKEN